MFQGRKQDLQRHVALQDGPEVVEHDHLVGIRRDQLEQAHRGQMPPLVGVGLLDFLPQDGPHRMGLGCSRPSEEVQAGRILPGHAADVVADDRLPPVQFGREGRRDGW